MCQLVEPVFQLGDPILKMIVVPSPVVVAVSVVMFVTMLLVLFLLVTEPVELVDLFFLSFVVVVVRFDLDVEAELEVAVAKQIAEPLAQDAFDLPLDRLLHVEGEAALATIGLPATQSLEDLLLDAAADHLLWVETAPGSSAQELLKLLAISGQMHEVAKLAVSGQVQEVAMKPLPIEVDVDVHLNLAHDLAQVLVQHAFEVVQAVDAVDDDLHAAISGERELAADDLLVIAVDVQLEANARTVFVS